MANEKKDNNMIIAMVAIVAIVALVLVFTKGGPSLDIGNANIAGEASQGYPETTHWYELKDNEKLTRAHEAGMIIFSLRIPVKYEWQNPVFKDVPHLDPGFGIPEFSQIDTGYNLGFSATCRPDIKGEKFYCPNELTTRGDFAAYLIKASGISTSSCNNKPFTDVPKSHENCPFIQAMKVNGIAAGYPDGKFGLNDPVTRKQADVMLYKTIDIYCSLNIC